MTVKQNNAATVARIGAGVRLTESATADILATLPEGFDPKVRGAVAEAVHAWAVGEGERPPVKIGKAGNQKATDYGRGVDALVKSVKRALAVPDATPVLRVSLSGEGGGTAVIPSDHKMYAALVALISAGKSDAAPLKSVA